MELSEILENTFEDTLRFRSAGFNFVKYLPLITSFFANNLETLIADTYLHKWQSVRQKYVRCHWEILFNNNLGKYLSKNKLTKILEVGCGNYKYSGFNIINKNNGMFEYYGIDTRDIINENYTIIKIDIFEENVIEKLNQRLCDNYFDVLIIDVEPHGREIQIHDIVSKYMKKNEYLCILRCIGHMDMFGSNAGNYFINEMVKRKLLKDMIAFHSDYLENRDGYLVMTGCESNYNGTIQKKYFKTKEPMFVSMDTSELKNIIRITSFSYEAFLLEKEKKNKRIEIK